MSNYRYIESKSIKDKSAIVLVPTYYSDKVTTIYNDKNIDEEIDNLELGISKNFIPSVKRTINKLIEDGIECICIILTKDVLSVRVLSN